MQAPLARSMSLYAGVAATVSACGFAWAADLRPSWECLPDDTAAMIRLPQPQAFLETVRSRTKFGAVALGPDRMTAAWDVILAAASAGENGVDLVDLGKDLAKYGLEGADVQAAFAGDMGAGMVLRKRDAGLPPLALVLAWMEPGPESAERLVAALQKLLEETAGDEGAPQRVDVEMAGHPVMWITQPIMQADLGQLKVEGGLDPGRLEDLRAELAERAQRAPKVVVGKMHFFVARVGGRLLFGQTLPATPNNVRIGLEPQEGGLALKVQADGAPADAVADPDRASGTDVARDVFERYLAAHSGVGDAPLADRLDAPAMRAALPSGETLVEALVEPRLFLTADAPDDDEATRRLAAVGLAGLGPLAARVSLDEDRLRQGLFLTLPAPRAGLFRILEQDVDAAEVPSFVTSEVVDFTQISLDLAQAYRTIKEFTIGEGVEEAANFFTTVEVQAQAWLGIELEAMLANLGSRHWIVTYPPRIAEAVQEARRNREAGRGETTSADRVAVVWKLADDAPVTALVPKLAALAQAQAVEEQGFQGVRLPGGVAVFVGQGHLVVGMGGDALEKTLAGIRNPPAGAASLNESDVPRTGADLVGFGPCRAFTLGDASRTGGMLGELRDLVTSMVPEDVDEDFRDLLGRIQSLMPSADEMQGMFGVGAAIMEVNDAGIAIRSAWEMPAP